MAELLQPPEVPVNGGTIVTTENPSHHHGLSSKRQRRPSVRLGEIGDQPATLSYESYRRNKLWSDTRYRFYPQKDTGASGKSSKTRPLTNFGNGHETEVEAQDKNHVEGDGNLDLPAITSPKGRDLKGKRGGTKRVRSNWVSSTKVVDEGFDKFSGDEWCRDYEDADRSESPLKEHSPIHSLENTTAVDVLGNDKDGTFPGQRRPIRARGSDSRDHGAIELDGPSDTDAREWKSRTSVDGNGVSERGRSRSLEVGIRMWLNGLGLGRYEPVFEIHEVDEEVLPLLTLEDLKDMGINAVGSRRKLYSAIQKLGRGFS